jgi:glycosyltransferase involved in cell wall biosynthesis
MLRPVTGIAWRHFDEGRAVGIQTSLDAVLDAERLVDAMRLADDLAFEASREPGARTLRVLKGALRSDDTVAAIAATHALAGILDAEATRTMSELLSDERPFLREHAAWALSARLPQADSLGRLIAMLAAGGFGGMLAQRTLEHWSQTAPEPVAVGLESALLGVWHPEARATIVETLGLVRADLARRPLLLIAADRAEDARVRTAAVAALGQRWKGDGVESALLELAVAEDELGDVARLALVDLQTARTRVLPSRDGLTIAQLFLHADIDAELRSAGAGDNGGIATLLVRLGNALIAREGDEVTRVLTMSRGSVAEAIEDLSRIGATPSGHVFGRIPLLTEAPQQATAWPVRVAARRGIRRLLRSAGSIDMIHLRMADVGSLAAADVARELDIPVIFTVAPDPHAVIHSLDLSGRLTRRNYGDADLAEHFWFRTRLVQRLAANAAHTVLFPRPALRRDMRQLVGIDIATRPERHTIVPEGVDLQVIERAVREARAHVAGAAPTPALAELRSLLDALPAERRGLPLIASVGRLHRVKGMATLVETWARSSLADRANLLLIGGDLAEPSSDEREQLALIDEVVPPGSRAARGLLLPGHRPNDVTASWVAAVRTGLPGLAAARGIYVCASLKEEFGIALLEAMASGLLVVAPDSGGPATYVVEGVTGFLTSTWDPDSLGGAMRTALDSSLSETTDRRAARSIRSVERSFTIQRMADSLAGVYSAIASDERSLRVEPAVAR